MFLGFINSLTITTKYQPDRASVCENCLEEDLSHSKCSITLLPVIF